MKELEKAGVRFSRVVNSALPQLFGDDTAHVLRSWVGKKGIRSPERFVRSITKMWGPSARSVIVSINKLTDQPSFLEKKAPEEPPYKSLLDATQKADAAAAVVGPVTPQSTPQPLAEEPEKPQVMPLALYRPTPLQLREPEKP